MSKFAQYYLKYRLDDLFAQQTKANRQKFFGALFEKDESIEFAVGEGEDRKVFKHRVYHLNLNKNIIVMRIANDTTKEVEQDFKKIDVKHEPSCFVVIDNRDCCRRIAVQKLDGALTPKRVCEILTKVVGDKMLAEHHIGIELFPQFYPKDFYKAWRMHQHHTTRLRFNVNEGDLPESFDMSELDDDSIMGFAIKLNEEGVRKKYRTVLELNPADEGGLLLVDEDSTYIRNLTRFCSQTGAPIQIETKDGARFSCFIDDDEDSASVVTNEIDKKWLEAVFDPAQDDKSKAEEEILKFVNGMKYVVDEDERKEEVA